MHRMRFTDGELTAAAEALGEALAADRIVTDRFESSGELVSMPRGTPRDRCAPTARKAAAWWDRPRQRRREPGTPAAGAANYRRHGQPWAVHPRIWKARTMSVMPCINAQMPAKMSSV